MGWSYQKPPGNAISEAGVLNIRLKNERLGREERVCYDIENKRRDMNFCFRWCFLFCLLWPAAAGLRAQSDETARILDQAASRLEAFPELESWQALVTSSRVEMDKNWDPKKELVVRKRIHITGQNRREDVLEARETEKGITRDVTTEYRERVQQEEAEASEEPSDGSDEDGKGKRQGFTLTDDHLFPFSSKAREKYTFTRKEDSVWQGVPVLVLESRALTPEKELMEGRYYLDKENLVVMRAELRPSRLPRVVKTIEMELWFEVLPEGYLVVKKTRVRFEAALVIKRIRMLTEEDYSEYRVLDASEGDSEKPARLHG